MDPSNVITVVRDPEHTLGKQFQLNPDGTVSKKSAVSLSFGLAIQHQVNTPKELVALLAEVSKDRHAAIINSGFNGLEIGEEFLFLSASEIEKRLDIPQSDRERQKGVHHIEHKGKTYKAVGRFKENVSPSSWLLLDRDIDEHTPAQFVGLETPQWMAQLAKILPGVEQLTYVETPSTSSRVLNQGKPIGSGNSHVWIKVKDPDHIERVRGLVPVLAAQHDMTWPKPRYSRSETGKVVGKSLTTILDPSVWTSGRLVFDGEPTVGEGLTVMHLRPILHRGEHDTLDLSLVKRPDEAQLREIERKTGIAVQADGGGVRITASDLTLDTEIESKNHGILSVRQIVERGITGKLRCQSPFRDSQSWAAFLSFNDDGIPFVFDSGTDVTHWLDESAHQELKTIQATALLNGRLPKVVEDCAAALETESINALATLQQSDLSGFHRARSALKQANNSVSLEAVDRGVKARVREINTAQTHHGYAKNTLDELTEGRWKPVGHHGELFVLNPDTKIWESKPVDSLIHMVADTHDGEDNCKRAGDYRAIAQHIISLATDGNFFIDVPNGVACIGGFYQIIEDQISLIPLKPEHRQRVRLDLTPAKMATPMFDRFLHETFESKHEGEEEQQIALMQEIAGGIMLGTLPKFQIAFLFYESFGRAGKGTFERFLRQLVPKEFVTAISPFKWHQDYHVVTLAGKRLNVVGELPENDPIPAAAFKSVIGGDLVTGRHPTHRPITFTNEATHLFMSNHLITTKDQSEAFFARWKIVEFPNSRLRSGLPIDKDLAQRIIDNEMQGIAYWALEGAARLLRNGKLSESTAHDRLMAKWRRTANSLEEFIHECCELAPDNSYRRSELYGAYIDFCFENGRKPFAKGRVRDLLEHNIGRGIRLVEINGYETFRGIGVKPPKPHDEIITPDSDTEEFSDVDFPDY